MARLANNMTRARNKPVEDAPSFTLVATEQNRASSHFPTASAAATNVFGDFSRPPVFTIATNSPKSVASANS